MKKNLKKSGILVLIFLFVGINIIPQINAEHKTTDNTILYVGGTGSGNYSTIQNAIDNSSEDDMIFVYDDSSPYIENIVIDESIKLIGENKDTTIIDGNGSGNVVTIKSSSVTLEGFTIQKSGSSSSSKAGVFVESNNAILTNLIIKDNAYGIIFDDSSNSIISKNEIKDNHVGIQISLFGPPESAKNTINNNTISYNTQYGLMVVGDENKINHNHIEQNNICIYVSGSLNEISNNNIVDNKNDASFDSSLLSMNTWESNYWDRARVLPKIIFGFLFFNEYIPPIPWINIDWSPAKEQYDIDME